MSRRAPQAATSPGRDFRLVIAATVALALLAGGWLLFRRTPGASVTGAVAGRKADFARPGQAVGRDPSDRTSAAATSGGQGARAVADAAREFGLPAGALPGERAGRADVAEGVRAPATAARMEVEAENTPFRPSSGARKPIRVKAEREIAIRITVQSKDGAVVRVLYEGTAAYLDTAWDGRDTSGFLSPAGTYQIVVETPGRVERRGFSIEP